MQAFEALVQQLTQSTSTGAFTQALQTVAQQYNVTMFANVTVSGFAYSSPTIGIVKDNRPPPDDHHQNTDKSQSGLSRAGLIALVVVLPLSIIVLLCMLWWMQQRGLIGMKVLPRDDVESDAWNAQNRHELDLELDMPVDAGLFTDGNSDEAKEHVEEGDNDYLQHNEDESKEQPPAEADNVINADAHADAEIEYEVHDEEVVALRDMHIDIMI